MPRLEFEPTTDYLNEWSARRKVTTYAEQHKHRKKTTYISIHASSGIWTHDPIVWADEDIQCISPRVHCDRHKVILYNRNCFVTGRLQFILLGGPIYLLHSALYRKTES
jgi:hypothetical protein